MDHGKDTIGDGVLLRPGTCVIQTRCFVAIINDDDDRRLQWNMPTITKNKRIKSNDMLVLFRPRTAPRT